MHIYRPTSLCGLHNGYRKVMKLYWRQSEELIKIPVKSL